MEAKELRSGRVVVVSNRLPLTIAREGERWDVRSASGGLVTALHPIMERNRGVWVGWPGTSEEEAPIGELLQEFSGGVPYDIVPVELAREEVDAYYYGLANEALWPLFHDLLGYCRFETEQWRTYLDVNRRFAEVTAERAERGDLIWVHDYQLIEVGARLRELVRDCPLAFFLHIPFPSFDLLRRFPWRREVVEALLAYDLVGFQTQRDRRNFVRCARELVRDVEVGSRRRTTIVRHPGGETMVGNFPISIDSEGFASDAAHEDVEREVRRLFPWPRHLVLGLDRLDYTKGIAERFLAFEVALERYPDLRGQVSLIQVVVPSRTEVADYRRLKAELDGLAGRINSRFTVPGWIPIHYMFRHLERTQLLAHYRGCDVALVTPLRDGMNLVAKEYCASRVDDDGVLILSEFAGAAEQLSNGALIVNPYDRDGTAEAIHQALAMPQGERRRRMRNLRRSVRRNDVHRWLQWFIQALKLDTGAAGPRGAGGSRTAAPRAAGEGASRGRSGRAKTAEKAGTGRGKRDES